MSRMNDSNHLFVRYKISNDLLYTSRSRRHCGHCMMFTSTMAKLPSTNYCIANVFYTMAMDPCAYVMYLAGLK